MPCGTGAPIAEAQVADGLAVSGIEPAPRLLATFADEGDNAHVEATKPAAGARHRVDRGAASTRDARRLPSKGGGAFETTFERGAGGSD